MIKIGGASAMWGDSLFSVNQLLKVKDLNYIMLEGLAEVTMAIMSRLKQKDPTKGYALDFIDPVIKKNLSSIKEKKVKIVTNGGGVNPIGAAKHLAMICKEQGIALKIIAITGDNLIDLSEDYKQSKLNEIDYPTEIISSNVISMNAYLGAFPIAQALDMGADVVITGRCVDSALALGPMIHEFGWTVNDLDLLAQGSLAGHLIECGAQSTGGLMTDWDAYDSWENMGYPVIECHANGDFVITKPDNTDGIVNKASVAEQVVYEIGDPNSYLLPDVVCDFTQIKLEEIAENRVKVTGSKGKKPTPTYKTIAHYTNGYKATYVLLMIGRDLDKKAKKLTNSLQSKFQKIFKMFGFEPFVDFDYELLGSESNFGANKQHFKTREAILKIAVNHKNKEAINLFSRELPSIAVSTVQSLCTSITGRQSATPCIETLSFFVKKEELDKNISLHLDGTEIPFEASKEIQYQEAEKSTGDKILPSDISREQDLVEVPLISLAYARSGDKGNSSNIGVIARSTEFFDFLGKALTAEMVKEYFSHFVKGEVYRYTLEGIEAYNFLLLDSLSGGGTASLRFDAQGKGLGQNLLEIKLRVPKKLTEHSAFKKFD